MKKIYTLLLLFTITLFYSIPTQAYNLDGNDIPIADLNNLTLNEVFVDNNIFLTYNFIDLANTTNIVNGSNFVSFDSTSVSSIVNTNTKYSIVNNNQYYSVYNIISSVDGYSNLYARDPLTIDTPPDINHTQNVNLRVSNLKTAIGTNNSRFAIRVVASVANYSNTISNFHIINTSALGLTSLTKQQLDNYYDQWLINNAYIQGYNDGYTEGFDDGFDDGYTDGFDDGVESETSYAVGYALGLSEGEDMETGSSLLILIVAAIGFIMMIFGFATKRRIFNLLSVGAFIVLGGLLAEFVGFIIITVGLVFVNVYYTFFGDI
jgi:hypothetical protein